MRSLLNVFTSITILSAICCNSASALSFGSFDPRSAAMGGTGVASATSANAAYFNPAWLARYEVRKEKSKYTQVVFPAVSLSASENVQEIDDFSKERYRDRIDAAVVAYNADPTQSAALVSATQDLQAGIDTFANEPVTIDSNAALVVAIPTRHQGGAFLLNQRVVMDGKINFSDADRILLDNYIATAQAQANGPNVHPELFDQDGVLLNPSDTLEANAAATAVNITELSMAMSTQVHFKRLNFLFGFTPKFMKVTTYDALNTPASNDFTDYETDKNSYKFNYDVGLGYEFGTHWTTGLVMKNMIKRDYVTSLGNTVHFKPQYRAGIGVRAGVWGSYAIDVDLRENEALTPRGEASQMLGFGGEWRLGFLKLRGGVSQNLAQSGDAAQLLYSSGLHFGLGYFFADFSFAYNSYQTVAALQFGSRF